MSARRQATLYLDGPEQIGVEKIRERHNPVQSQLIRAHVTLCREDEVEDWQVLEERLIAIGQLDVALQFDKLVRDGDLVYLASRKPASTFHQLRHRLLATDNVEPRIHQPHLTLIHPRNGTCDADTFASIESAFRPFEALFQTVTLIEQENGGPWRDLKSFPN